MPNKIVAIHQPNFFPWLGYFDKIARSDIFILMDNVQFPKKGGTWSNRVQMLVDRKASWVTMPISRAYHGIKMINDMEIDNGIPWREKLLTTVWISYGKAPFFETVFPLFCELVNNQTSNLAEFNRCVILSIADKIGIDTTKIIKGSSFNVTGSATDLIINMTIAAGGDSYLAGGGAAGYQEDEKFPASRLGLIYQNFTHPVYPQINTDSFVPGLSIIDALMNIGFDGVKEIVK